MSAANTPGGPVDLEALSHLMGDPAPDTLAPLLASFWELEGGAPRDLRRLADARDSAGLAAAAHGAKGAASLICARAAADLCRALEASARAQDWAAVAVLVVQIEAAYAAVGAFIAKLQPAK